MKKIIMFLIFVFTLIVNMFLVVFWNPSIERKNYEKGTEAVFSNTKSLYKVDQANILKNLDEQELEELNEIISDLSTFEMGEIINDFNDSDQSGIISAFRRLKRRLREDDYKRIKEILGPFIDIEEVENVLKNKYV